MTNDTLRSWEEALQRLKDAYDHGYYSTEPAVAEQTAWPWQNKTCKDCPFWQAGFCQVKAAARAADADTCEYFDPANHDTARTIINEWDEKRRHSFWSWYGI